MTRFFMNALLVFLVAGSGLWSQTVTAQPNPKKDPPVVTSPDGRVIVIASGNQVSFFDTQTQKELIRFVGHTAPVSALAFSPDGKLLACGSEDKSISLLEAATGKQLLRLNVHAAVVVLNFSQDGKTLHSVEANMASKEWDIATGKLLKEVKNK